MAGGPYLGLVPFEERDARLFYGRDELADQLVRRLAERLDGAGILLVAGESGSGKSSLLRAGLLPRLAAGGLGPGSERWPRRVIRPTASPLRELAMALAELAGAIRCRCTGRCGRRLVRRRCWPSRRSGPPPDTARTRDQTGHPVPRPVVPRLVLVVDQFEELFTAGQDADAGRGGAGGIHHGAARGGDDPGRAAASFRRRWWSRRCARITWAASSRSRR